MGFIMGQGFPPFGLQPLLVFMSQCSIPVKLIILLIHYLSIQLVFMLAWAVGLTVIIDSFNLLIIILMRDLALVPIAFT